MRTILSIMLLCFCTMAFAVDLKPGDNPQLIDVELVDSGFYSNDAVSYSDVVIKSNSDSNQVGLNDISAINLPSPSRVPALPGYNRTLKFDTRIESTESYKASLFRPNQSGSRIYEQSPR